MADISASAVVAVRRARSHDVPQIARLHAACFADPWPEDFWQSYLEPGPANRQSGLLFVASAHCDGPISGLLLARRAADEAEILTIAVTSASRRQGVARDLLCGLISELRQGSTGRLFLEVSVENVAALALYGQLGFAKVGRRVGYYRKPDGRQVDAMILALCFAQ